MKREQIESGVRESIAQVLNVESQTIGMGSRLIRDLGADSLDLLELTFLLQQKFGVVISSKAVSKRAQEALGDRPLEVDGVYTPEALEELRKAMPEVPREELHDGLTIDQLPRRLRGESFVNLVQRLLEENGNE
ncbi:MAG: acyl carrier protein [Planctomycetota bacterium]|jgi:acyl carrier protein